MRKSIAWRGLMLLAFPIVLAASALAGLAASRAESSATRGATLESAKLLLARGDAVGAERELRELSGPEATFLLGRLLAEQGRWNEARSALQESLSNKEHRTHALRLLAKGSMEHRDWESACAHFAELDRDDPKDPLIFKLWAICLLKSGDPLASLRTSQRALDVAPGDRELMMLMSEAAQAASGSTASPRVAPQPPRPLGHGRRIR